MSRSSPISGGILHVLAGILTLYVMAGQPAQAQESTADEDEVRAAMLFNLTRFVEWPNWKSGDAAAPFTICLLGADASVAALDKVVRGKTVEGKAVNLRRLGKNEDGEGCRILYVAHSERKRFEEIQPALAKAAVLTVGDQGWFLSANGIVGLPLIDNRVRIEINLGAAQRGSLSISSKLLRIATVVR